MPRRHDDSEQSMQPSISVLRPPPSTVSVVRCTFIVYLIFFLGRSWLEWPHLRLRQLVALGGRRACIILASSTYVSKLRFRDMLRQIVWEITYVALPANHLVTVVLHRQCLERWLD